MSKTPSNRIRNTRMAEPNRRDTRSVVLALMGSSLFALFVNGIYEYLALRGVVNTIAAWTVLIITWAIGVTGIVLSELTWGGSVKHRVFSGIAAAIALGILLLGLNFIIDRSAGSVATASAQIAPSASASGSPANSEGCAAQNSPGATVNCAPSISPQIPQPAPSGPKGKGVVLNHSDGAAFNGSHFCDLATGVEVNNSDAPRFNDTHINDPNDCHK